MASPAPVRAAHDAAPFLDTNVVLYLFSEDAAKADRAEDLLRGGATVGVQVLNEFASVASRKLKFTWAEIEDALDALRRQCTVRELTLAVHQGALRIVQRHSIAWYDALHVSAALDAGCRIFYSEDMHHGLKIDGRLTVRNPFKPA